MNDEAEPCPFCGSYDISDGEIISSDADGSNRATQSMCRSCDAIGPKAPLTSDEIDYGSRKARAAWDRREEPQPIIRNIPAPGDLKIGDYVFASRWGDCSPGDPWEVNFVTEIADGFVRVGDSRRPWVKAMRITSDQGARILATFPQWEGQQTDYRAIARVFNGA